MSNVLFIQILVFITLAVLAQTFTAVFSIRKPFEAQSRICQQHNFPILNGKGKYSELNSHRTVLIVGCFIQSI